MDPSSQQVVVAIWGHIEKESEDTVQYCPRYIPSSFFTYHNVQKVVGGEQAMGVMTDDSRIFVWGYLPDASQNKGFFVRQPVQLETDVAIADLSFGRSVAVIITDNGEVFLWVMTTVADKSSSGFGGRRVFPHLVAIDAEDAVAQADVCDGVVALRTVSGRLLLLDYNNISTASDRSYDIRLVEPFPVFKFKEISIGKDLISIVDSGEVLVFPMQYLLQGKASPTAARTRAGQPPFLVVEPLEGYHVSQLSASESGGKAAVAADCSVYVWDWPSKLGLEDGWIDMPEKIAKIESGKLHLVMVMESGAVYSWGCGEHGQLGVDQSPPVGLTNPAVTQTPQRIQLHGKAKNVCCGVSWTMVSVEKSGCKKLPTSQLPVIQRRDSPHVSLPNSPSPILPDSSHTSFISKHNNSNNISIDNPEHVDLTQRIRSDNNGRNYVEEEFGLRQNAFRAIDPQLPNEEYFISGYSRSIGREVTLHCLASFSDYERVVFLSDVLKNTDCVPVIYGSRSPQDCEGWHVLVTERQEKTLLEYWVEARVRTKRSMPLDSFEVRYIVGSLLSSLQVAHSRNIVFVESQLDTIVACGTKWKFRLSRHARRVGETIRLWTLHSGPPSVNRKMVKTQTKSATSWAPELCCAPGASMNADANVDTPTDVWNLGVVLYHLMCGMTVPPTKHSNSKDEVDLSNITDPNLVDILESMLRLDPKERQSPMELLESAFFAADTISRNISGIVDDQREIHALLTEISHEVERSVDTSTQPASKSHGKTTPAVHPQRHWHQNTEIRLKKRGESLRPDQDVYDHLNHSSSGNGVDIGNGEESPITGYGRGENQSKKTIERRGIPQLILKSQKKQQATEMRLEKHEQQLQVHEAQALAYEAQLAEQERKVERLAEKQSELLHEQQKLLQKQQQSAFEEQKQQQSRQLQQQHKHQETAIGATNPRKSPRSPSPTDILVSTLFSQAQEVMRQFENEESGKYAITVESNGDKNRAEDAEGSGVGTVESNGDNNGVDSGVDSGGRTTDSEEKFQFRLPKREAEAQVSTEDDDNPNDDVKGNGVPVFGVPRVKSLSSDDFVTIKDSSTPKAAMAAAAVLRRTVSAHESEGSLEHADPVANIVIAAQKASILKKSIRRSCDGGGCDNPMCCGNQSPNPSPRNSVSSIGGIVRRPSGNQLVGQLVGKDAEKAADASTNDNVNASQKSLRLDRTMSVPVVKAPQRLSMAPKRPYVLLSPSREGGDTTWSEKSRKDRIIPIANPAVVSAVKDADLLVCMDLFDVGMYKPTRLKRSFFNDPTFEVNPNGEYWIIMTIVNIGLMPIEITDATMYLGRITPEDTSPLPQGWLELVPTAKTTDSHQVVLKSRWTPKTTHPLFLQLSEDNERVLGDLWIKCNVIEGGRKPENRKVQVRATLLLPLRFKVVPHLKVGKTLPQTAKIHKQCEGLWQVPKKDLSGRVYLWRLGDSKSK